jgi:hypothetical protein
VAAAGTAVQDRASLALWWLIPVSDLFKFAVWIAGSVGNTVEWHGMRLRLSPDGRIRQLK